MFDVTQWSAVIFFDVVGDKDFSVTSGETCSLADTASEKDHCRSADSNISLLQQDLLFNNRSLTLAHDTLRGPCQKRQKIFDYAQEGHLLATKEAPKLDEIVPKSPSDLEISTEDASKH